MDDQGSPNIPIGVPVDAPPVPPGNNMLALIGLLVGVASVLSTFLMWVPIFGAFITLGGFVLATTGVVLSILGRKRAMALRQGGAGTAVGGLLMSLIGLVISLMFGACHVACFAAMRDASTKVQALTVEQQEEFRRATEKLNREFEAMEQQRRAAQPPADLPAEKPAE